MDVMLRDCFVCGLRDEHLQQRLFAERDLTFLKGSDIAVQAENATDHQRQIRERFREVDKADVSRPEHQRHEEAIAATSTPCYGCEELHSPRSCTHQTVQCMYCRKFGHIAKACIERKKPTARGINHAMDPERTNDSIDQD